MNLRVFAGPGGVHLIIMVFDDGATVLGDDECDNDNVAVDCFMTFVRAYSCRLIYTFAHSSPSAQMRT